MGRNLWITILCINTPNIFWFLWGNRDLRERNLGTKLGWGWGFQGYYQELKFCSLLKIQFKFFNAILKCYFLFSAITKYRLYTLCCTIYPWACLKPSSFYSPHHITPLPTPHTGDNWFVLCLCDSASFLLYLPVCYIF